MRILKHPAVISVALFLLACCLPAVAFSKPPGSRANLDTWIGAVALLMGWLGMFTGNFAWFANIFWLAGSLFLIPGSRASRILALLFCALSLALSLTAFALPGKIVDGDEGGVTKQQIEPLRIGAYVWISAMAVQLGAALHRLRTSQS